jgi:hypothetical protein
MLFPLAEAGRFTPALCNSFGNSVQAAELWHASGFSAVKPVPCRVCGF